MVSAIWEDSVTWEVIARALNSLSMAKTWTEWKVWEVLTQVAFFRCLWVEEAEDLVVVLDKGKSRHKKLLKLKAKINSKVLVEVLADSTILITLVHLAPLASNSSSKSQNRKIDLVIIFNDILNSCICCFLTKLKFAVMIFIKTKL